VRQALYSAIDRTTYADVVAAGTPDRAAKAILPSDNPLYPYLEEQFMATYPFDPTKATRLLQEAGWRPGPSGTAMNSSGEPLHLEIRNTSDSSGGGQAAAVIADMWKSVGVDPEIYIVPTARVRDTEFRQQFPGGEITARGNQDSILTRLECIEQPTPQNRFAGNNRGHWCTPEYERLVGAYRASLDERSQGLAIRAIQDLVVDQLPMLPLNVGISSVFARRGVTAFQDDFAGGADGRIYGSFSRNAHEWDITS
jgi:peptide/nickel transport system substrate-binding protein